MIGMQSSTTVVQGTPRANRLTAQPPGLNRSFSKIFSNRFGTSAIAEADERKQQSPRLPCLMSDGLIVFFVKTAPGNLSEMRANFIFGQSAIFILMFTLCQSSAPSQNNNSLVCGKAGSVNLAGLLTFQSSLRLASEALVRLDVTLHALQSLSTFIVLRISARALEDVCSSIAVAVKAMQETKNVVLIILGRDLFKVGVLILQLIKRVRAFKGSRIAAKRSEMAS